MGKEVVAVVNFIFFLEQSSSLHIRKKRVIDLTRNGGPVHLSRAPYIVNILKNGESHCAGTILDADIIITTPYCIDERPGATYRILSNSRLRNNGTPHHVTSRSSSLFHGFGNFSNGFFFFIIKEFIIL